MKNKAKNLMAALLALIMTLTAIPFNPITAKAADATYPTEPLTLTSHGMAIDASVKFAGDDGEQHAFQDYLTRVDGQDGTIGYCVSPFKGGVYPAGSTTVKVKDPASNSTLDKKLLGIMMAGYPAKTAAELGLSEAEAYYATEVALENFLFQHTDAYPNAKNVKFSDNDWEKHWSGNDKVIAAAKKIYDAGVASPYNGGTTGEVAITPVGGDNKMTAHVTDEKTGAGTLEITFEITADPPFTKGKIVFDDPMIKQIVSNTKPTSKILVNGVEQSFKAGIMGGDDYTEGIAVAYKTPKTTVKIVLDKLTAETYVPNPNEYINANFKLETEGGGTFAAYMTENTANGYQQNYAVLLPQAVEEKADFALTRAEGGGGDEPPGEGGLKILKYNKKTHQLTPGAIFHVLGLDDSNYFINVQIQATAGAAIPLPNGGEATTQNGVITLTKIPTGNYKITEISPPPNFDYCDFGVNSQVVYVPEDGLPGVFPQVAFENNPYGGMEILKVDSVTGKPVNGAILRIRNPQTGYDQEFTTLNGGKITLTNLPQGNYEASEVYAPPSYVKSSEKKMVAVVWGETTKVTFENTPKTALALLKIDAVTGEKLEGAVFELVDPQSGAKRTLETFSDGVAYAEDIPAGVYNLTEIHAPTGYILDKTTLTVVLKNDMTNEITLQNSKTPTIIIDKYDEKTGERLGGAEFRLSHKGGVMVEEFMMDATGQKAFPGLPVGWYTIEEIAAPWGYLAATESKDVYLDANQVVHVKFDNRLRPALEIVKVDEETKRPLAGARFKVWKSESKTVSEYVTGADGRIIINNLDEAVYSVEEITAPAGYLLESQHKDIQLEWGVVKTLIFTNKARPKLRVLKVDAVTGLPLANAEFRVTKVEDKTISEYITGADGTILIENLDEAIYRAEEFMPPSGYLLYDESKEIALEWGKTKTLKFDDIRKPTLIFTKLNGLTNKPIANAVFKVEYEQQDGGVAAIGTFRTDANGKITLPQVSVGWYILTEVQAAPGFSLPSNPVTRLYLSAGQNAYTAAELSGENGGSGGATGAGGGVNTAALAVTSGADYIAGTGGDGQLIYNFPLNSIVIKKTDVNTGALLSGAAFELYRADEQVSGVPGTAIGRYTMDNSGIIVAVGLDPGFYVVKEVSPPPNYLIAENSQQNGFLKADGTTILEFSFANIPYGSLLISKVDGQSKKPLAGARFKVTDGAGAAVTSGGTGAGGANGEFVTDANGEIIISNLKPAAYVITEIEPPQGYAIDTTPQTVQIGTDGKTYKVTFANQPFGGLLVKKVDAQTNKPLMGARFKVTDSTGAAVTSGGAGVGNVNGEYVTDTNGEFTVSLLKPGAYIVTELSPPQGYALDGTPQTVNVTADGKAYTLTFADQPLGTLVIKKYNSVTHAPLSGAEFKVTTAAGNVIGTGNGVYITDVSGTIQIPALDKGGYIVREVKAPTGFILEEQAQTITVDYGKTYTLDFYNKPKSSLQIIKVDSETKKPLKDARFTVYRANGEVLGTYDTDGDGLIIISGIDPGWLKIVEVKAPIGYQADDIPRDVEITSNQFLKVTFENKPLASIIVKKIDDKSGVPLVGAVFVVQKQDGKHVGEYTTDRDGTFTVPNAERGYYIIREQRSPDGYLLDETPKTVEVKTVTPTLVTFTNKKLTALQIVKTDEKTGEPLGGARFSVEKQNGERVGEYVTDKTGLINIPTLAPDYYVVREIAAPQGYLLDNSPQTVQVKTAAPTVVTFTNRRISGLQIIKVDASTNTPLSGARFTVYKKSGDVIGEYTTDQNGVAIVDSLVSGWYKIAETKAPTGYLISEAPKDVEVTHGEFIRVVFADERLAALEIKKVDEKTNEPLAGAVFKVTKMNGEVIGDDFTTGKDGLIHIPTLAPGFYTVSELKSPQGYLLDNAPKTVEVRTNAPTVLTVTNRKQSGLQIIKVDASTNTPLSGARFTVYKKSGDVIGEYTTDQNGVAIVDNLASGWYKIAETKAPTGYLISEAPKDVEVTHGEFIRVVFADERLASLQIKKVDEKTGAALAGARFTVEKQNGEKIYATSNGTGGAGSVNTGSTEWTTDGQGLITIPSLSPGFYVIREIAAPSGYVLDESPKTVEVKTNAPTVVTFSNKRLASLQIKKIDEVSGAALAGAVFVVEKQNGEKIYATANGLGGTSSTDGTSGVNTGSVEWVTDAQGLINIPALSPGFYIIREVKAPANYIIDGTPKTVEVKTDAPTIVTFANKPLAGLKIVKLNAVTRAPIEGVEFTIDKMNGEHIDNNFRQYTFKTDKVGQIYVPNLSDGYYLVTETKTADGYFLDAEPKTVLVQSGKTTLLEVLNVPMSGLLIVKTDEKTGQPLQGVVFDVKRVDGQFIAGSILDKNQPNTPENSPNKSTSPNGDITGSYTTDANGRILINGLDVGEYNVVERKQLDGYELDASVHEITITPGKLATLQLTNKQKSGLRLIKIDSISKKPIYNVEFMLFDAAGKVVDTFYTDNNGVIDFTGVVKEGKYTIRETRPAQGYYTDEVPRTIQFKSGEYTELRWENVPFLGQIQLIKKSADDNEINGFEAGTPLEGAVFEIADYKTGNVVDRIISGKDGRAVSNPLPLGRYIVREVQAPQYYKLSDKTLDIELEFAKQIVRQEFLNYSANTGVYIRKVGNVEAMPGDEIRYDIKEVRNTGTVALTDFYWRDVIPVSAARLTRIVTGTYNQSLKYKILITTNKGDNRVIADNLSTTRNNVVDCSAASLGLKSDEFVTTVTLVFGTVKAGFCQVETPQVFVKLLPNLQNGLEFANKADVAGRYGKEWIAGTSTWKTTVFNPKNGILPRTGY